MPRIICGSSASSLLLAVMCTRPYHMLHELMDFDVSMPNQLPVIHLKTGGMFDYANNLIQGKGFFCPDTIKNYVKHFSGDLTFQEIYEKYGWKLNITVTDYKQNQIVKPQLLNYLTTPNVVIWSAVQASCAAPGLYEMVELMRKNQRGEIKPYFPVKTKQRFADGGLSSDLPKERIKELFGVNSFIVSQVNPHVVPFISVDAGSILDLSIRSRVLSIVCSLINNNINYWV